MTEAFSTADSVRVERRGAVTTVILNRPAARNAVDRPTAAAVGTSAELQGPATQNFWTPMDPPA